MKTLQLVLLVITINLITAFIGISIGNTTGQTEATNQLNEFTSKINAIDTNTVNQRETYKTGDLFQNAINAVASLVEGVINIASLIIFIAQLIFGSMFSVPKIVITGTINIQSLIDLVISIPKITINIMLGLRFVDKILGRDPE